MIYTRTGDEGTTSTFSGKRVRKDDDVIEVIGIADEVIAHLQLVRSYLPEGSRSYKQVSKLVEGLFQFCAEVSNEKASGLPKAIQQGYVDRLEDSIKELEKQLDHFVDFKNKVAVITSLARARVRTLERLITPMVRNGRVREVVYKYVNRMSDYLFILALSIEEGEVLGEKLIKE